MMQNGDTKTWQNVNISEIPLLILIVNLLR